MKQLETNDITPLYIQLSNKIQDKIEQGEVQYGNQIHSEAQMCQTYNVSRVTVRKAVELLVEQGVLTKRQGKGTYVAFPAFEESMLKAKTGSFSEMFSQADMTITTKVIDKKVIGANANVAKRLSLHEGEPIIRIQRIRYVNQVPAMFEEDFFSTKFDFLLELDLNNLSLFSLIHEKTGLFPKIAQSVFLAKLASVDYSNFLDVARGEALLFVCQLISDANDKLLYYNEQTIRSDVYKYVVKSG